MINFGVAVFPGSNCDQDCFYVIKHILKQHVDYIWHTETNIKKFDCIILPGGFSYGDYLRCGALAKCSPVIDSLSTHIENGKFVIGICNGFQILTESRFLPGVLTINKVPKFICRSIDLIVSNVNTPFTNRYNFSEIVNIPIAHKEGRYLVDKNILQDMKDNNQIVFKYFEENPNGSVEHIAGIINKRQNVLGMMPHPERASEKKLGSNHGYRVFESVIKTLLL